METLFIFLLALVVAGLVCALCYAAVLIHLFLAEGLAKTVFGFLFPPYAYVWGWRQRRTLRWTTVWTCAAVLLVSGVTFLQLQMG